MQHQEQHQIVNVNINSKKVKSSDEEKKRKKGKEKKVSFQNMMIPLIAMGAHELGHTRSVTLGKIGSHSLNRFIVVYRSIYRYEVVHTVFM